MTNGRRPVARSCLSRPVAEKAPNLASVWTFGEFGLNIELGGIIEPSVAIDDDRAPSQIEDERVLSIRLLRSVEKRRGQRA